jgi:acetyl esterase/lipase
VRVAVPKAMAARGSKVKRGRWRRALPAALIAFATGACSPLSLFDALVPKDPGVQLVAKDVAFGSGPRQRMDVYRPRTTSSAALPIIVFIYGGSWQSGSKSGYSFVGRALAGRGFVVAIPDYRPVPQVRYPVFLQDNAAAVEWVIAHAHELGGDPHRIILSGHSAGAYNAAMLALDPRWLGKDRSRVRGLIGLAGPYDFLPLKGDIVQQAFGGVADPASTQPVRYVQPGDPPAFLATGAKDDFVRPRNSDSLAARLRSAGVPVERKTYPGVGHVGLLTAIAKPLRGRASVLDDMAAFAKTVTQQVQSPRLAAGVNSRS